MWDIFHITKLSFVSFMSFMSICFICDICAISIMEAPALLHWIPLHLERKRVSLAWCFTDIYLIFEFKKKIVEVVVSRADIEKSVLSYKCNSLFPELSAISKKFFLSMIECSSQEEMELASFVVWTSGLNHRPCKVRGVSGGRSLGGICNLQNSHLTQ